MNENEDRRFHLKRQEEVQDIIDDERLRRDFYELGDARAYDQHKSKKY